MDSMVHSDTPEPAGADQSLGDLVALAAKDVSQLIRYEIDLAKSELKVDAQRSASPPPGSQPLHIRRTRSFAAVCRAFQRWPATYIVAAYLAGAA
jgi:hypothetical protein